MAVPEPRLSIRLTRLEMARVEALMEWLQGKFPKNAKIGQKTLFLEALDALDWRNREAVRKAGKKMIQVTLEYTMAPEGVVITRIDDPAGNTTGIPHGVNQAPTSHSLDDLLYLFVRDGWQPMPTDTAGTLVFERLP